MENNIVLYRGDCCEIDKFRFSKTNRGCLVGQGVYLTNKLSVADSYRTKGIWNNKKNKVRYGKDDSFNLFSGEAPNKQVAMDTAFQKFLKHMWKKENNSEYNNSKKKNYTFESRMQDIWYNLISENIITVSRTEVTEEYKYMFRGAPQTTTRVVKGRFRFTITYNDTNKILGGYVTTFEFPKRLFEANVINVDTAHKKDFLEILYEQRRNDLAHLSFGLFSRLCSHGIEGIYQALQGDCKSSYSLELGFWSKVRHILEPYGVIGFEYNGGQRLGGGYNHRAFCIWDESFVNQHKVSRVA